MIDPALPLHRQAQIKSYRESGLTLQAWCGQEGISKEQMKYWMGLASLPRNRRYRHSQIDRRAGRLGSIHDGAFSPALFAVSTIFHRVGALKLCPWCPQIMPARPTTNGPTQNLHMK